MTARNKTATGQPAPPGQPAPHGLSSERGALSSIVYRLAGLLSKHRLRNMITLAFALLVALAAPAVAAPGDGGVLLSLFNLSDDNGIRISQYQLALKPSGVWNELLAFFIRCGWAAFSWGLGAVGWFAGWTFGLPWLSMVSGLLHSFAALIESDVIGPLGLVGLMCTIAAIVAFFRLRSGGSGSAATEVLVAILFAVVAGLMASNPVLNITDVPVKDAQRVALVAGNMITSDKLTDSDVDGPLPKADPNPGQILVTAVVRPMHAAINYGVDIDHNKCRATYNQTLKAGPYENAAKQQFRAMNSCDSRLGDYAKNPSFEQLIALAIAMQELGSVAMLVGVFGLAVNAAAILVVWSAFAMFYQTVLAIASSEARSSVLESAARTCMNLIFLVVSYTVMAGSLRIIKVVLTDQNEPLPIRVMSFNTFTLLAAVGIVVLFIRHQRAARKLAQSAAEKVKAPPRQPSRIGTAVGTQLARQATWAGTQGAMGLARGSVAATAGAFRAGSAGVRLIKKAAIVGGSAATGGAVAAATKIHSGVMAVRRAQAATRMIAKPTTQGTVDAGDHVQRIGTPKPAPPTATSTTPGIDANGRPYGFQPAAKPKPTQGAAGDPGRNLARPAGRREKTPPMNHRSPAETNKRLEQVQQPSNRAARRTVALRTAAAAARLARRRKRDAA